MSTDLHSDALVIDSHNDTVVGLIRRGNLGLAGESSPERRRRLGTVAYVRQQFDPPERPMQQTLPLLREGGIDAGYFAVDTTIARNNHLLYALDALGYLKREVETHSGEAVIARSAADIEAARAGGRFAVVLAVENSAALQHSLFALDALYEVGVRTMTLTHSARTDAADGCEVEGGGGLTGFGREVVRRMGELGMLLDVSHVNERGFWDVLECATSPVVASHSCCRALCDHPRNLTDEQLRALGEAGGVVGITFVPDFIDADAPDMGRLVDHVLHAVDQAGEEAVGLGSDFDGGGDLLAHAGNYPEITAELLERGAGEAAVRAILGLNHLRLLRQVVG